VVPTGGATGATGPRPVRVVCSLTVPAGATVPEAPVTVHLEILDVSLADAPATPVARVDVVATGAGELAGPYRIDAGLTPGRQYAVSAHVDCSGDGSIAPGDLLTTTRVVVPVDDDTVLLDVPLTEIG
jgi:uncharacterized lipoprotein YbaY